MLIFTLLLFCSQETVPKEIDEDTEAQAVAVILSVIAQADRIPPEFSEQAEQKLQAMSPNAIPHLLRLMQKLDAKTIQRIDKCGEAIITIAKRDSQEIPQSYLQKFAESTRQSPESRRIALKWLNLCQPGAREEFLLRHLGADDEVFKRQAIDASIQFASNLPQQNPDSIRLLQQAFREVRDLDQAERLSSALKERGVAVSPLKQMGVIENWSCETVLKSAIPVESRSDVQNPSGAAISVSLKRDTSELLTHVIGKYPISTSRMVLRSLVHSDLERDVIVRVTCNKTPELHVNGEETTLRKIDERSVSLVTYSRRLNLLRGKNDFALKFSEPNDSASLNSDAIKSEVQFCVQIVNDLGKGLSEPQVTSAQEIDHINGSQP